MEAVKIMTETAVITNTLFYDQESDCGRCSTLKNTDAMIVLFVITEEACDELARLQDLKQNRRRGARTMLIIHSNHGA